MKANSLKKLLVIKEKCSWLPPGWMDGKFAADNIFHVTARVAALYVHSYTCAQ